MALLTLTLLLITLVAIALSAVTYKQLTKFKEHQNTRLFDSSDSDGVSSQSNEIQSDIAIPSTNSA